MPFNSRDMWVYLKAQDLATRALNSFGRSVRNAGNQVRIAQIEAEQAAKRAELAQGRLIGMTQQNRAQIQSHIAGLQAEKAQLIANDAELATRGRGLEHLSNTLRSASQVSYAAGFALTSLGVGGALAMKGLIDATVEYDRQVRLTSTQISDFDGNFRRIGDIGLKVAHDIGVGFQQIQPALYDIFSSIDINVPDAQRLLTAFAKAAVAGQTDIQSVSRGTLGILNSFHMGADQINHVLDLQFKFIQKGVGTYDEWAKKIGLVSPSAVRAGQSLDMMIAALAEASRMSGVAARAGTAVARAFDAFSNPNAVAALKKIGVSAVDAAGNFRPFIDVMFELRTHLDKIPGEAAKTAEVVNIFKGAGGTIEARRFLQNLLLVHGNLEQFKSILDATKDSAGALDTAYGIMADSTAAKTERLKNRWQELKISLGEALIPVFNRFLDFGEKIIGWFDDLTPKTKQAIANFIAIATAIGLVIGPLVIVFGWFSNLVAVLIEAGPEIATVGGIISGVGVAIAGLAAIFYLAWQKSASFRSIFSDIWENIQVLWYVYLVPFGNAIVDIFEHHLKPALESLWTTINDKVIPAVKEFYDEFWLKHKGDFEEILNDIKMVVEQGFKFLSWAITTLLIPALNWLIEQYHEHKKGIDQIITAFEILGKWIAIIAGSTVIGILIANIAIVIGVIAALIAIIGGLIWLFSQIVKWVVWLAVEIAHLAMIVWRFLNEASAGIKAFQLSIIHFLEDVAAFFRSLPGKILSALGNLGTLLWDAGRQVIQGFLNGVESLWDSVRAKFDLLTKFLKLWKGPPARDRMILYDSGQMVMQGFMKGIDSVVPMVRSQLSNITNDLSPTINTTLTPFVSQPSVRDVHVHINTNEINPRQHAIELGRLLAGSL